MIDIRLVFYRAALEETLRLRAGSAAPALLLHQLVAQRLGIPSGFSLEARRDGRRLTTSGTIAELQLTDGEELTVLDGQTPAAGDANSPLRVRVLAGPHVGESFRSAGSAAVVGRAAPVGHVCLNRDDTLSRLHLELRNHAGGEVLVTDLNSTNGVTVNGRAVGTGCLVRPDDDIRLGQSTLRVASLGAEITQPEHLRYDAGHLAFNRNPRVTRVPQRLAVSWPAAPPRPSKRRFNPLLAAIPLLSGLVMFLVTRNPLMLAMLAVAPLMAVATYLDDRFRGRKEFVQLAATFHTELADAAERWRLIHGEGHDVALARWPSSLDVYARALERSADLWARDPADSDFLDVRVGVCAQASNLTFTEPHMEDEELRQVAAGVASELSVDGAAPLVLSLNRPGDAEGDAPRLNVWGVVGERGALSRFARSVIVQLATLHSPHDVAIAVLAPGCHNDWGWASWLPHTTAVAIGSFETTVALTTDSAPALFEAVVALARTRHSVASEGVGFGLDRTTKGGPHLCVVVQPPISVAEADVTGLVDLLEAANMSLIWLASDRRQLPRKCQVVIETADGPSGAARVQFNNGGATHDPVDLEETDTEMATHLARALAPLVDVTAVASGGSLPDRVNLLDQLGLVDLDAKEIEARWEQGRRRTTLEAVVGACEGGSFVLPLRHHAVLGGTTGSGKSELLQSWVASLALSYPPERLNFVFVDFKGGLGVRECRDLPHTVGLVTNLDGHLAERVLTSLQAECDRRARILAEHGVSSLEELLQQSAKAAPASLVVVFDEFKEAVDKVPASADGTTFIAQVKSLAALGRAYGIHLLLATQTPEGVITEDLKNNIEQRVALRVKSADISRGIIGRPDAALIDRRTPGRAFAEVETGTLVAFQGAYVGGRSSAERTSDDTFAALDDLNTSSADPALAESLGAATTAGPTDLQRIVEATNRLAQHRRQPSLHRPWNPELATVVTLQQVLDHAGPGQPPTEHAADFSIPLGRSDEPRFQRQDPFYLDLGRLGSVAICGGVGAGKSTALRTVAGALTSRYGPDQLHLYAVDMAGTELAALTRLPHTAAVVGGREVDRIRQTAGRLNGLIDKRLELFAEAGVSTLAELATVTGRHLPRIVVLIDGLAALHDLTELAPAEALGEEFRRLLTEGRSTGVFAVVTVNRSTNLPYGLMKAIPGRLILRMNSPEEYSSGLVHLPALARRSRLPDGRCFTAEGLELQLAVVLPSRSVDTDEPKSARRSSAPVLTTGAAQAEALDALGTAARRCWPGQTAPRLTTLPRHFGRQELPPATLGDHRLAFALDELDVAPVFADFEAVPTFVIAGPDRSGRTTTVSVFETQFQLAWPNADSYHLSPRRATSRGLGCSTGVASGDAAVLALLDRLQPEFLQRRTNGWDRPLLLAIDDADAWITGPVADKLNPVITAARDTGVWVVAALSTHAATKAFAPWWKAMQSNRQGLQLMPEPGDLPALDRPLPRRVRLEALPGRGFHLLRSRYQLVQVAC